MVFFLVKQLLNLPVKSKAEIILLFSVTHVHVYFCNLLFFGIYLQKKQQDGRNDQIFVSANFSNLNDASLRLKASKVFLILLNCDKHTMALAITEN